MHTSHTLSLITFSKLKFILGSTLWLVFSLHTQALDPSDGLIPNPDAGSITQTGFTSRTASNVVTYDIPITNYPSSITVDLRGGDGGFAQSGPTNDRDRRASKGGGGIEGTATFNIHPTNAGALRPGGQIRLIPGNKGFDRQSGNLARAASGGGGGSGVLYHGPLDSDDWHPLIIAGGGGGAYASTVTGKVASSRNGGAGQASESGQRGISNGGGGGSNGQGGSQSDGNLGGAGGGWMTNGAKGGGLGYPLGGAGGVLNVNTNKGAHGGFGCGGGGDGGKVTSVSNNFMSGGGGGGYSGGGSGANNYGGGGGGSFVATGQTLSGTVLPIANANANRWTPRAAGLKQHGYVTIQTAGNLLSEALPTITAQDITIDFGTTAPYTNTGVSAHDVYGRSINFTVVSSNVNVNASGSYTMNYEATDQYGQTVEKSRTVTVRPGSYRPTFTLPSSYNITQAGQQTQLVATNFNANWFGDGDSYESLVRYEIRGNSNPSLLSGDPTIANNGKINITPSGTAPGVTTLTIVAIDNGPDPTVRESLPKTIELRINLAPSAGHFLVSSNPDVFSTSINYSEDSSSLVVGIVKSIDPDNQADLTYRLSGTDGSKFTLGLTDGVLRFKSQPNYETPNDNGGNRIYDLRIATQDPSSATSASSTIISDITVHLLDVNEPPTEPTLTNTSVPENTTVVGILNSTDPDLTNNTVSLQIDNNPSTDGSLFKITTTGNQHQLEFISAPDFEDAQDFGNDNSYTVNIIASSNGQSTSRLFTINVTNVEEPLSTPLLHVTNDPIYENQKVIGFINSEDSDDTTITYGIAEDPNTDWQLIDIEPSTGVISFKSAPDYENPDDVGGNRVYYINVTVTSGPENITQGFAIPLANLDEAPSKPTLQNSITSIPENTQVVDVLEATDPEGDAITFEISQTEGLDSHLFSVNPATNELIFTVAPDFENLVFNDEVEIFTVCVIARAGDKSSKEFFQVSVTDVDEAPTPPQVNNSNAVPHHPENVSAVGILSATDPDGDAISFSISTTQGADSSLFQIDPATNELQFKNAPNYENPTNAGPYPFYEVVVIATDGNNSTTNSLQISVDDVNEAPTNLVLDNVNITENSVTVGHVSAIGGAENGDTIQYSISNVSGADSGKFHILNTLENPARGKLIFNETPNFEQPHSANGDNIYEVAVVARVGNHGIIKTFSITVTDASPTSGLDEFRATYNLAADGSEDWLDRSGDGLPNIASHLLGLGDPSKPSNTPASENAPGKPKVEMDGPQNQIIVFTYSCHRINDFIVTPQISENLLDWEDPSETNPAIAPLAIETSAINDDYNLITIFYLRENTGELFDDNMPAYPNLHFRVKMENN